MTGKEYSRQWADECGFTENQLLALDPNCVRHFDAGVLEGRAQLQAANIEKDERIAELEAVERDYEELLDDHYAQDH
jgi:hypothetical protein